LCYKWAGPAHVPSPHETPSSNTWKLRIITPVVQNPIVFQKEVHFHLHELHHHELHHKEISQSIILSNAQENRRQDAKESIVQEELVPKLLIDPPNLFHHHQEDDGQHFLKAVSVPKNLRLRRFSGYYLPSQYYTVCKYKLETQDDSTHLSLRFKANNQEVKIRLEVWDLNTEEVLYDLNAVGEFLVPSILVHSKSYKEFKEEPSKTDVSFSPPEAYGNEEEEEEETQNKTEPVPRDITEEEVANSVETIHSIVSLEQSEVSLNTMLGEQTDAEMEGGGARDTTQRYLISISVLERSWEVSREQWNFVNDRLSKAKQRMEEMVSAKKETAVLEERGISSAATVEGFITTATTEEYKDETSKDEDRVDLVADDLRSRAKSVKYGSARKKSVASREAKQDGMKRFKSTVTTATTVTAESNLASDLDDTEVQSSKVKSKGKKEKNKKSKVDLAKAKESSGEEKKDKELENLRLSVMTDQSDVKKKGKKSKKKRAGSEVKDIVKEVVRRSLGEKSASEGDIPARRVKKCRPAVKGVFKFRRHHTANLTVELGGKHSQRTKHTNQPNWILEILTDAEQVCVFF